ncbi:MAG: hypothetical protein ACIAS6_14025 [Phycisphaerales bacterium JB060]
MKWSALLVAGLLASSAPAQDDASQRRADMLASVNIALAEATADDASGQERAAALDRAIRARSELMSALPGDTHLPIWMLDQAADILTRLTMTLADARLVVGLPDRWDRDEAVRAAQSAYELARDAGRRIEERFERQRSILEAGGELAPGDRELNRRLAQTHNAVRRPLLMGRSLALRIAGGDETAQPAEAVALLENLRVGEGEARNVRDGALAVALLAQNGGAQRALQLLDGVLAQREIPPGSRVHAEAALLRGRLERGVDAQAGALAEAADNPPFVDAQGLHDPALLVLATEARARVLVEGDRLESSARTLIGLEDRLDLGSSRDQRASIADDRLAALAQGGHDWSEVSPDVVLRVARSLVLQDRPFLDEQAIALLAALLGRFEADRARALEAGEEHAHPPERPAVMELLARVDLATAGRLADDSRASEHRVRALRLTHELLSTPGADLDGLLAPAATLCLGEKGASLEPAQQREILAAAIAQGPVHPLASRWRLGLAASLMAADQQWPRALGLAEQAMRSADAATRADAIVLAGAAHALLVERAGEGVGGLSDLESALVFVRQHPDATGIDRDELAMRVARALLARGRGGDALGAIAAIEGVAGVEATILRASAHDAAGQSDLAFAGFLEASRSLRPGDGDQYWQVWTRMLELLDAERGKRLGNGNRASAEAMEARIRGYLLRLKSIDADLGGRPWAHRLERVEANLVK